MRKGERAAAAGTNKEGKGRRRRRRFFAEGVVLVTGALYRSTEAADEANARSG